MPRGRTKLLIVTVAWGDWHVAALTDFALPSLLSPRNLPFLAMACDLELLIVTRPEEQSRIETSDAVRAARRLMLVHIHPSLPAMDHSFNVFEFHHLVWNFARERAKQVNGYVFNLPPDTIYADGAGVVWSECIAQGRASIWWVSPRVLDSIMPVLREQYLTPDGMLTVSPREMVGLSLEYLHPLAKAFFADSDHFLEAHPEIIVWPVADEGLLLRGFIGEGRLFDPNRVEFTAQHVMTGNLGPDDYAVLADSDDFYTASLAPAGHNADFYRKEAKAEPVSVGQRWFQFDGASNDLIGACNFRVHRSDVTESLWRRIEARANLFMGRAAATRDFLRIAAFAAVLNGSWTAGFLRKVAETTACLRAFPRPIKAFIFGPTDGYVDHVSVDELLEPEASARLLRLLRNHVVINHQPELSLPQQVAAAGGMLRLRSLAGREVIAAARPDGRLMLDRFKLGPHEARTRSLTFIPLHGVLDPELAAMQAAT